MDIVAKDITKAELDKMVKEGKLIKTNLKELLKQDKENNRKEQ